MNLQIREGEGHVRKLVASFDSAGNVTLGDPTEIYNFNKVVSETKKSVSQAAQEIIRYNQAKAKGQATSEQAERAQLAENKMMLDAANAFKVLDEAKETGALNTQAYNREVGKLVQEIDKIQSQTQTKIRIIDENAIDKGAMSALREFKALQKEIDQLESKGKKEGFNEAEVGIIQRKKQEQEELVLTIQQSTKASDEYLNTLQKIEDKKTIKDSSEQYKEEMAQVEKLNETFKELEKTRLQYQKTVASKGSSSLEAQVQEKQLEDVNRRYNEQRELVSAIGEETENSQIRETIQEQEKALESKNQKLERTVELNKMIAEEAAVNKYGQRATALDGEQIGSIQDIQQMKNMNQELQKYAQHMHGADAEIKHVNSSKRQFVVAVQQADGRIKEFTYSQNQANGVLHQSSQHTRQVANRMLDFQKSLGLAAKRMVQWVAVGTLIHGTLRSMQEGIRFITELDTELTQVAIIQQGTRESVQGLKQDYVELGREMRASVAEISRITTELTRQGLEMEEAQARMQTILKLSRAGMVGVQESLKIVTASVNAMRVTHENAGDVMLRTSQITASSVEEIGEAFSKTASSAYAAGLSIEETAALLSGMIETTQEGPSQIGTSLKTILARFNAINKETGEVNEELNKVQTAYESVGIEFTDQNGQIRNAYDLLEELAGKWNSLDKNTKSYLATVNAGVRMQSRFFAIMSSFDKINDSFEEVSNSAGVLDEAFETSLGSVEAHAQEARVALEAVWIDAINDEVLIYFYKLKTAFLDFVGSIGLVKIALGLTTVALIGLIPKMVALSVIIKTNLIGGMAALGAGFQSLILNIGILGQGLAKLVIGTKAASLSLGALLGVALPVIAGIGALAYAIHRSLTAEARAIEAQQEAIETARRRRVEIEKNIKAHERETESIENSIKTIDDVNSSFEELIEAKNTLAEIFPSIVDGYDTETGAAIINNEQLEKEIALREELTRVMEEEYDSAVQFEAEVYRESKEADENRLERMQQERKDLIDERNEIAKERSETNDYLRKATLGAQLERTELEIEDLTKDISDLHKQMHEGAVAASRNIARMIPDMSVFSEGTRNLTRSLAEHFDEAGMEYDKMAGILEDLPSKLQDIDFFSETTGAEDYRRMAQELGMGYSEFMSILSQVKIALREEQEEQDELNNIRAISEEQLKELQDLYSSTTDKIQDMYVVLEELNDTQELSAETQDKIIRQYPELMHLLGDEEALRLALIEMLREEERVQLETYLAKLKYSEDFFNQSIDGYESLGHALAEYYEVDFKNWKDLQEAKESVINQTLENMDRSLRRFFDAEGQMVEGSAMMKMMDEMSDNDFFALHKQAREHAGRFGNFESKVADFTGISFDPINRSQTNAAREAARGRSSKGSGASKKATEEYAAQADALQRLNNERQKLENQLSLNQAMYEAADSVEEQNSLLQEQIEINKKLQKNSEETANAIRKQRDILVQSLKKQGFNFAGTGDDMEITNLDHIAGKSKEVEEQLKEFFNLQLTEIPNLERAWWDYGNTMESLSKQIKDNLIADIEERRKKEVKAIQDVIDAYEDQLETVRRAREELGEQIEGYERQGSLGEYLINQEIEQLRRESDEIDRQAKKKIEPLTKEIEELQKRNDRLSEEEERRERNNKLIEAQIKLQNTMAQKNTRVLQRQDDGSFEYAYVADPDAVESDHKAVQDILKSNADWERDLRRQKEIEEIQDQIDHIEETARLDKKGLELQIVNLTEFINEHKRLTHEFYGEEIEGMDTLIENIKGMEDLSYEERKAAYAPFIEEYGVMTDRFLLEETQAKDAALEEDQKRINRSIRDERDKIKTKNEIYDKDVQNVKDAYEEGEDLQKEFGRDTIAEGETQKTQRITQTRELKEEHNEEISDMKYTNDGLFSSTGQEQGVYDDRLANTEDFVNEHNRKIDRMNHIPKADQDSIVMDGTKHNRVTVDKKHDGGIIGAKTNKNTSLLNKLFNLKPNEEIVKALKGELFIPPNNIKENFFPNMNRLVGSLTPTTAGTPTTNYNIAKIEFPNVESAEEINRSIINLPRKAKQHAK